MAPRPSTRSTGFDGEGTFPRRLAHSFGQAILKWGLHPCLYGCGALDINLDTATLGKPLPVKGVAPLLLPPAEITLGHGLTGGRLVEATRHLWEPCCDQVTDLHLAAVRGTGLVSTFCWWGYDPTGGHYKLTDYRLAKQVDLQPLQVRCGFFVVPDEPYQQEKLARFPERPAELAAQHKLLTSIIVSNNSPLVRTPGLGKRYQDTLVGHALAAFTGGSAHFSGVQSAANIVVALSGSPYLILSFGVAHVPCERPIGYYEAARKLLHWEPRSRVVSMDTMVTVVQTAILQAVDRSRLANEHIPDLRAADEVIDEHRQGAIAIVFPLAKSRPRDAHAWRELRARVEEWLKRTFRFLLPVWISGNGVALPGRERLSPYWALAACLTQAPVMPRSIAAVVNEYGPHISQGADGLSPLPQARVTDLTPQPASNGHRAIPDLLPAGRRPAGTPSLRARVRLGRFRTGQAAAKAVRQEVMRDDTQRQDEEQEQGARA